MKKVVFCFPSNNPDSYIKYFHTSLRNIVSLTKKHHVAISIIPQEPWTIDLIKKAADEVEKNGIYFTYQFEEKKIPAPMAKLRYLSMLKVKLADYFIMCDDNFEFGERCGTYIGDSGERFCDCIEYMEKFKKCGFIMCEGSLGGWFQKYEIKSTNKQFFSTTRGIVIRNIGPEEIWEDSIHSVHRIEDAVACFSMISKGYFPAKQFNSPTKHKEMNKDINIKGGASNQNELKKREWQDEDLYGNSIYDYIRQKYDCPKWSLMERKIPEKVKENFIKNGGNEKIFKEYMYPLDFKRE